MTKLMVNAKTKNVQVVSEDVFDDVRKEGILSEIKNKAICDWGSEVRKQSKTINQITDTSRSYFFLAFLAEGAFEGVARESQTNQEWIKRSVCVRI